MAPGTHIAVVAKVPFLSGRFQGWELRDTILVLTPGPSVLYVSLFRVPLQEPTVITQVLKTGTGTINIDATRVATHGDAIQTLLRKGFKEATIKKSYHDRDSSIVFSNINRMVRTENRFELAKRTDGIGRWPSNLVLIHHAECVNEGTKRVKNVGGSSSGQSAFGQNSGWNFHNNRTTKISRIRDEDGLETVPNWICHPTCPVGLLDAQSGELKSGEVKPHHMRNSTKVVSKGGYHGNFGDMPLTGFGDSGGASRFYPQFKNLPECLDWIDKLINPNLKAVD